MTSFVKKWLAAKTAAYVLVSLFSLVILYHLAILFGVVPYDLSWGGRLQNESQMFIFESISVFFALIIIVVSAMKANILKARLPAKLISMALWFFVALFLLNTIGNLFALNNLETILFTPVTFISALMCYRLALE